MIVFAYKFIVFAILIAVVIGIVMVAVRIRTQGSPQQGEQGAGFRDERIQEEVIEAFADATLVSVDDIDLSTPIFDEFKEVDIRRAIKSLESSFNVDLGEMLVRDDCTLKDLMEEIASKKAEL